MSVKARKKTVLAALKKHLGVVTPACEAAGVDRSTFYKWLKADPDFKEEYESLESVALDFAESQLLKNISNGHEASVIFYLKTKGKKRGYIERSEVASASVMEVRIVDETEE